MSEMNRDRFEESMEAYALGSLTDEERRGMEEYMKLHPELRPEVEELTSVANMMSLAPAEHEPSREVRQNLMRTVRNESSEHQEQQSAQPSVMERLFGSLSLRTLIPAAVAVIAVVLLGWNVMLQGEVQNLQGELQERQSFAMEGSGAATEVSAEVVELEGGKAIVMADNMPSPPEGKTMQVWVIHNEAPTPAGTFNPDAGPVAVPIEESLKQGDTVAITVEPEGGSEQPTSDPVLHTSIST